MGAPIWPAPTNVTRTVLLDGKAGGDGLDLGVLLEALDAVLATDAAGLVAAERRIGAVGHATVDADGAGAQSSSDRGRPLDRSGRDVATEAVLVVVGDPHRVV